MKLQNKNLARTAEKLGAATLHRGRRTARRQKDRIYIVMENRLLRESLVRALRGYPELELAGSGGTEDTIPEEVVAAACDVVLVDFVDAEWMSRFRNGLRASRVSTKLVALGTRATGLPTGVDETIPMEDGVKELVLAARRRPGPC